MPAHESLSGEWVHTPFRFVFADQAAREATTNPLTSAAYTQAEVDANLMAIQTDDFSMWLLTGTTPDWEPAGGDDTVYNSDGTINDNRTVTLEADLKFLAGTDGENDVEFGDSITDRIANFNAFAATLASLNAGTTNDRSYVTLYGTAIKGMELGYFENETDLMGFRINVADDGDFEVLNEISADGLKYAAIPTMPVDETLVWKSYVDGLVGSGTLYNADGTLAGNRVVDMDNYTLQFYTETANREWSVFAANGGPSAYSQRASIQVDHNQIKISDAQALGGVENTEQSIIISPSGMSIQDALNNKGFVYNASYLSNYDDRTIPDWGAVKGWWVGNDQSLSEDREFDLDNNDWSVKKNSSTDLATFHGDGNHSLFDPFITLHEGFATGNGTNAQPLIVNYGKGVKVQFNDGTRSSDTFYIRSVLTGAENFDYMETSYQGVRHDLINIDQLDWYFDSTGTRTWSIYDDDLANSPDLLVQLDSQNKRFIFGEQGANVSLVWPTGVTADDQWRLRVGNSSDRLQFFYYDDSLSTSTAVTTIDSGGSWRIDGDLFAEGQTSVPSCPQYPSQVEGAATNYTVDGDWEDIVLDTSTYDRSGSEYTINLASNQYEMDRADGTKMYEVRWDANFLIANQGTGGATRSTAQVRGTLDSTEVTGSFKKCYIREYQGASGTNGYGDNGSSGSFMIQPAADGVVKLQVRGVTESGQTLTDFELESISVKLKRVA